MIAVTARGDGKTWAEVGALLDRDETTVRLKMIEEFGNLMRTHSYPTGDAAIDYAKAALAEECRRARAERGTAAPLKLRPGELRSFLDG